MQHLHETAHLAVELVRLSALHEPAIAAEDDHLANRSTLNRKRHAPRIPYRGACSTLKSRLPQQPLPYLPAAPFPLMKREAAWQSRPESSDPTGTPVLRDR